MVQLLQTRFVVVSYLCDEYETNPESIQVDNSGHVRPVITGNTEQSYGTKAIHTFPQYVLLTIIRCVVFHLSHV